jgi:uncharacterized protein YbjQ (UPF0145 family)
MRNVREILVTTTSTVDGMSVKQYIKPISSHVVAGTNFFSDFFASFSDVFGGRSQTYQRQLSSIYLEAIELLKQSANEVGANCILGLKVDLDEISGKGKSMFMVTATGTAVIIENLSNSQINLDRKEKLQIISIEKMKELRRRGKIIGAANNGTLKLDDETWKFIAVNCVYEISAIVLERVSNSYDTFYEGKERLFQQLITYLMSLPEEHRTKLLYEFLMSGRAGKFESMIYKIIKDLLIFDFNFLNQYLGDTNEEIKMKALQLVVIDKSFYSKEDIEMFENLVITIESSFSQKGEISSQKKLLSTKEKEIWVCVCGSKNEIDQKYCNKCSKDIYGFSSEQINPSRAIEKLKRNIELIRSNIA